jgi:hypothetical protein
MGPIARRATNAAAKRPKNALLVFMAIFPAGHQKGSEERARILGKLDKNASLDR